MTVDCSYNKVDYSYIFTIDNKLELDRTAKQISYTEKQKFLKIFGQKVA